MTLGPSYDTRDFILRVQSSGTKLDNNTNTVTPEENRLIPLRFQSRKFLTTHFFRHTDLRNMEKSELINKFF
uniref:Uncharacterized protein n=1 Tax=Pararge aegeria TaxID=116150 RepID=S4P5I7_9NEOP